MSSKYTRLIAGLAITAGLVGTVATGAAPALAVPAAPAVSRGAMQVASAAAYTPTKRSVAISRAKRWLTANNGGPVPYSQRAYFEGWRTDCSGYVSMTWNLMQNNGRPANYSTVSMLNGGYQGSDGAVHGAVVKLISWDDLKAGDAIGFLGSGSGGDNGHVMLFEKWADSGHTRYWVYEQAGDGGTHYRTHARSYNGYKPYRYNKILED